jgi:CPA2 family monovalent cation:H+ antiporter-2
MIETEWVTISENSLLVGKTIGELGIRSGTGASVVAIIRGSEMLPNPGPEASFEVGDVVGVLGSPDQRAFFRELAYDSQGHSSYFF